jgi:formylglycine-generating enzyme required for sulfatase activity
MVVPLNLFVPGNDCQFTETHLADLKMSSIYSTPSHIAGPQPGQSRHQWLEDLQHYRQDILNGVEKDVDIVTFDYQGVRAWMRLDENLSKAWNLRPGAALQFEIDTRWHEGNDTLTVAFDIHRRSDDQKISWTGIVETLKLPADGLWHNISKTMTVPDFDAEQFWLRPVFGFDATLDPAPGQVDIRKIALSVPDSPKIKDLLHVEQASAKTTPLDLKLYDRDDLKWLSKNFACHFTFMYDQSFYYPDSGYTIESFLQDGIDEFGGYDSVMLWHAYPRIGVDDRNQFDFYRDMPGGLEGLREVVDQFHSRDVKVFINYNPWDKATRDDGITDQEALAEMVAALNVDGIFLDTMFAASEGLRDAVDAKRKGVTFVPEALPETKDIGSLMGSWFQFWENPFTPALLHHKWIEPRHMQYQINRWIGLHPHKRHHDDQINNAFFNGSGMMIWENIFASYNPWPAVDRALWRRAVRILHAYPDHFVDGVWDPFYPTEDPTAFANRWTLGDSTLFTLINTGSTKDTWLVNWKPGLKYYDLWNGTELQTQPAPDGTVIVKDSIEKLGCVIAIPEKQVNQPLKKLLAVQQKDANRNKPTNDKRNQAHSVIEAQPVPRTQLWTSKQSPKGMVYVPGAEFAMELEHVRRECGCYPDPGTPKDRWYEYYQGWDYSKPMTHHVPCKVQSFYIDEAEVTNAEYKAFLDATGYEPKHLENFLKHWSEGIMPPELADHPVVYVDLDDARAYAEWAGKRLPTEKEWHLAAQGTDGRTWPWGNEFDESKCNTTGDRTLPVRSLPDGQSPFGCYHMAGNVYEWTESCRDDGHTRWCIIRGGSFYDPNSDPAKASIWYVDGGPRPCTHHAKFILMWPGLDRCATIGFRCVVDVTE